MFFWYIQTKYFEEMYIGRIITKNKNINTLDFVDVTDNFGSIDNFVPTLVIGKKNAENFFGKHNIKVLDKHINDNVIWTFDKTERRNEYENELLKFNSNLIKNINKKIKYEFFNFFIEPCSRVKKLLRFVKSNTDKYIYINNEHVYMYFNDKIYGFSLTDIEYMGVSKNKVLTLLKSNEHNHIVYNKDFLSQKMRNIIKDNNILVPYFYFLTK